ncbi:MAG: type II toxin-antitoxin system HicA family toxin [Planctomycetia bacterium]|nr:type II toxin-antitoxin system HicA family toxin [Planctomycetia bacterium]
MAGERRFSEVRAMLEAAGYQLDRIHGSHHIFTKPAAPLFSIPVHHGKVKPFYVRQVAKLTERGPEPG